MSEAKFITGLSWDIESQVMATLRTVVFLDPPFVQAEWDAAAGDSTARTEDANSPLPGAGFLFRARYNFVLAVDAPDSCATLLCAGHDSEFPV